MLALSRKAGESPVITLEDGRQIRLKVVAIDGKRARIAIDAPDTVRILRGEVVDNAGENSSSTTV